MGIPGSYVFRLWSLRELAKDSRFKKYLLQDEAKPTTAISKELRSSEQPGSVPAETIVEPVSSIDHEDIVLGRSSLDQFRLPDWLRRHQSTNAEAG
jgi:hypothetical protein